MKRALTTIILGCLAFLPLGGAHFFKIDDSERVFDPLNATFEVECVKNFEISGNSVITFKNGEWRGKVFPDTDIVSGFAWIENVFSADLVKQNQGKEVIAEIHCNAGGSHSWFEVQIFDSVNGTRLGNILTEFIDNVHPFPGLGHISTRTRNWKDADPHCCPSKYVLTSWIWGDDNWELFSSEIWNKEDGYEYKEEIKPFENHVFNIRT